MQPVQPALRIPWLRDLIGRLDFRIEGVVADEIKGRSMGPGYTTSVIAYRNETAEELNRLVGCSEIPPKTFEDYRTAAAV